MIDQIKFQPSQAFLTEAAASRKTTVPGFGRSANILGDQPGGTIVLKFQIDRYSIARFGAKKLPDGSWWVKRIEANRNNLWRLWAA